MLAGRVELAPVVKLELLAEVSEQARLERVCELLEARRPLSRCSAAPPSGGDEQSRRARVSRVERGSIPFMAVTTEPRLDAHQLRAGFRSSTSS